EGAQPGAAADGRRGDGARAEAPCAAGRAGDRLPLGRTVPGGGDAAPLADQPAWAAALGADLQLRPGAAGDRAQGVGRAGCEFHRRTARTRQAREAQRPGDRRALRGRDGEPGRLSHEADAAIARQAENLRSARRLLRRLTWWSTCAACTTPWAGGRS